MRFDHLLGPPSTFKGPIWEQLGLVNGLFHLLMKMLQAKIENGEQVKFKHGRRQKSANYHISGNYLKWRNPEPYFRLFWVGGFSRIHKPYPSILLIWRWGFVPPFGWYLPEMFGEIMCCPKAMWHQLPGIEDEEDNFYQNNRNHRRQMVASDHVPSGSKTPEAPFQEIEEGWVYVVICF